LSFADAGRSNKRGYVLQFADVIALSGDSPVTVGSSNVREDLVVTWVMLTGTKAFIAAES
jgi:hypothetical protein